MQKIELTLLYENSDHNHYLNNSKVTNHRIVYLLSFHNINGYFQMKFKGFNIRIMAGSLSISIMLIIMYLPTTQSQLAEATLESELQGNTINLAISNITIDKSTTGLTSVSGILFNNSTENVENIQVDVKLFDAENKTLRETSRFVTSAFYIFEPGSIVTFNFLMSAENFDHYTARAFADRVQ